MTVRRFLARSLAGGTAAGIAAVLTAAALARRRGDSPVAPINATSHMVWGPEAALHDRASVRHTLTGLAITHASAILWAGLCEGLLSARRRPGTRPAGIAAALAAGAATAATAWAVDYRLMPKRLTPGWELALPERSLGWIYGAMALAMAASARVARRRDLVAVDDALLAGLEPGAGTQGRRAITRLPQLVNDIEFAMLTTVDAGGQLHSRPLATLAVEGDGSELAFFTSATSRKVFEVDREQHVNVSYSRPGRHSYVSVSGSARISHDRVRIQRLWKAMHRAWFPNGPDDPDLVLLLVSVEEAEWWDAPSGKIVAGLGMLKAAVTGRPLQGELTEHGVIRPLH